MVAAVKLPSLRFNPRLPDAPAVPVLCLCGAGPSAVHAPADSWMWAVNPRANLEYPRLPDVVTSFDPKYWETHHWRAIRCLGKPLVVPMDSRPELYEGSIFSVRYPKPRFTRNPFIPGIGHVNWSAPIALLAALTIWRGPIVLAGVDLTPPTYTKQAKFWGLLAPVLPSRVYRLAQMTHQALEPLRVWEGHHVD